MKRGLFIGRFQPFHNGHLHIVKDALTQVDELLIVIGSTQEFRTKNNPLTANERENIITQTLQKEHISNCRIFQIPDINDDDKYTHYVTSQLPKVDIVFTGENKLVKKLFEQAGFKVIDSDRINGWMATEIRNKILNNEDYSDLVPHKEIIEPYEGTIKGL